MSNRRKPRNPALPYKDLRRRHSELVEALGGAVELTDRDRQLLGWLATWPQSTTDAAADLFGRLAGSR